MRPAEFQLEQRCENLGRAEFRLQLLEDFIHLQCFILTKHAQHPRL